MQLAVAYARVSTGQQEQEQTIRTQLHDINAFVKKNGYSLMRTFTDENISGSLENRPGLMELFTFLEGEGKGVDTVIVWHLDRLARDNFLLMYYVHRFKGMGKKVVSVKNANIENLKPNLQELILNVTGFAAAEEREQIKERSMAGKVRKVIEQEVPVCHLVPYGYRYIPRSADKPQHIVLDDTEAAVVRDIFSLYIESDMSLYKICDELQRLGIPTKQGKPVWKANTITGILKNEAYIGIMYYGKARHTRIENKQVPGTYTYHRQTVPKKEWLSFRVPAVIDASTFAKAQLLLQRTKHRAWNRVHDFMLTGVLYCGVCGRRYNGYMAGNKVRFYRCSSRRGDLRDVNGKRLYCRNHTVNADRAEPILWGEIKRILFYSKDLKELYLANKVILSGDMSHYHQQIDLAVKREKAIKQEELKIASLYAKGNISYDTFQTINIRFDKERVGLTEKRETAAAAIKENERKMEKLGYVEFLAHHKYLTDHIDELTGEEKKHITADVIKRITVNHQPGHLTVEFNYPTLEKWDLTVLRKRRKSERSDTSDYKRLAAHLNSEVHMTFIKDFRIPHKRYTRQMQKEVL